MEQSFNFKRALLVFKSIFICNKRVFKPALLVYVGIIAVFCVIDIVMSRNGALEFNVSPIGFALVFFFILALFPTLVYSQYHEKLYTTTSYMQPASIKEKFLVPLFISSIFMPALLYGVYVLFILLSGGVSALIENHMRVYVFGNDIFSAIALNNKEYFPIIQVAILTQSICGLSLMLFGKLWVFPFIVFTIGIPKIHKMLSGFDIFVFPYNIENAQIFVLILLPLLFWTISYLKFRKLQTKK